MKIDHLYEQILSSEPSSATFFLILSRLKEEGHLKRVIQECKKALSQYPFDVSLRQLLAESYYGAGQIAQAEKELEEVAAQIDNLIQAYKLQAEVLGRQGRGEEAARALNIYMVHRPDDQEAMNMHASLTTGKEIPGMVPSQTTQTTSVQDEENMVLKTETAEETVRPQITTPTLAEIYVDQGQIHDALEIYERVVAQNPEDERSKQRLAELKTMSDEGRASDDRGIDGIREKKQKMISILETWLAGIREKAKTPDAV